MGDLERERALVAAWAVADVVDHVRSRMTSEYLLTRIPTLLKAVDADSPVHQVGDPGMTLPDAARPTASTNAEEAA